MAIRQLCFMTAGIALSAMLMGTADAAATRKITLDAFSVWETNAQIVQIAPKRMVLTGTLGGTLFIEGDEGPEATGGVACPARIEVNMETGAEEGQGHCTFTADDGAKAFGDWKCSGSTAEGCSGDFTLAGGTGRLATIKGSSDILFLAHSHDFDPNDSGAIDDDVKGITVWPELKLSVRRALASK